MPPAQDTPATVYVLGLHQHRRATLVAAADRLDVAIAPLLRYEQLRGATSFDVPALLDQAERELADAPPPAGITTYWDFPSRPLAAILSQRHQLPTAGLRAVATWEHKYWSRLVQREVVAQATPRFEAVDPRAPDAAERIGLPYPYWLKPVKSYSGYLGFRIDDRETLDRALEELRHGTARLGRPFQDVLERIEDVPDEVAAVPGTWAIAEAIIDGHQCTLEGVVHDGRTRTHGLFDIERADDGSTFTRYVYPSRVEASVRQRMDDIAADLMDAAGYDSSPFNIEFFIDGDDLWILEVNPRVSQEHSSLTGWVDGTSNLDVMLRSALGLPPEPREGQGPHTVAGKAFHRHHGDATVDHAPTDQEIAELERRFAPCSIEVTVSAGDRLSELPDQEPDSAIVAHVYAAASDHDELERKLSTIRARLPFTYDESTSDA